jgi:hypothetical protein
MNEITTANDSPAPAIRASGLPKSYSDVGVLEALDLEGWLHLGRTRPLTHDTLGRWPPKVTPLATG